MDLSEHLGGAEQLLPRDGSALLYRGAISAADADAALDELVTTIRWEQHSITMFGRTTAQPRLVAWYGDGGTYTYSGLTLSPHAWTKPLLAIKDVAERIANERFNSMLANLYRDGQDAVSWHADNEPELGHEPVIASVSLGADRRFDLRHRQTGDTVRTVLPHGSVLVMSGGSQTSWIHQVPRTKKVHDPRVNLTFRRLVER